MSIIFNREKQLKPGYAGIQRFSRGDNFIITNNKYNKKEEEERTVPITEAGSNYLAVAYWRDPRQFPFYSL